jgi:rhamnopyranosyl-N-acetylglucosaminyl-diphospho-decaprenol beta-1,3/1,4-galactofuranosyltransferase
MPSGPIDKTIERVTSMEKLGVVIVAYNNTQLLLALINDLKKQTRPPDTVIVIDNGDADISNQLRAVHPAIEYAKMAENTGSAGGYFEGMRRAAADCDYIWTLDDDTGLERDTLEQLVKGFVALSRTHRLGAVRCVGINSQPRDPFRLEIAPWRGTLFSVSAVKEVGLPEKEFFLYGEDLEYSLRLRSHEYDIFWIPSSRCTERRFEKVRGSVFGRQVRMYHTPARLYYAIRNELFIFCKYRRYYKMLRTMLYTLKVVFFTALSSRNKKWESIRAIGKGVFDAARGRLGKRDI